MSFKTTTKILIPCFIAIIIAFGFWFFYSAKKENLENLTAIFKEEKREKSVSVSMVPPAFAQTQKYENVKYGFSFNYQSDFTVREFPEDGGKTALIIQNEKLKQAIQIYITSYDDPDFAVGAEQIRRDLPDMPFLNSADVMVGGKAKGLAFFSQNESFGETAEVWFAHDGKFFQATTYGKDAKLLEEIIKSWRFK